MNRQRKLIKSVCIAGLAGVLAAGGVVAHGPVNIFAEGLAAEEGEVIVLTPENLEALKIRMAQDPGLIIILEDGTQRDLAYLETMEATGETVILKRSDVQAGSGNIETPADANTSVSTETPADTENQNPADSTGGQESPGTNEDPGNPGTAETPPEEPEKPGEPENPSEPGNPGEPENPSEPTEPDNPGEPTEPENPGESTDPDNPGNPENPGEPTDPENPSDPENPGEPTEPDNPGEPTEPSEPGNPVKPLKPIKPGVSEEPDSSSKLENPEVPGDRIESSDNDMEFGSVLDRIIVDVDQFEPDLITPERISNASILLNKQLVKLPKIVEDFRFWTVARKYAFAKEDLVIREKMPAKDTEQEKIRAVGSLKQDGLLYILKEESNGWFYVESGRVRGFVRSEKIMTGEEASRKLEEYQKEARQKAEEQQIEYSGIENTAPMAEELIPWKDNEAFTYLRATVSQTVVGKRYALAKDTSVEVKEDKDASSRTVGVLPQGGLCYVLEGELENIPEEEGNETKGSETEGNVKETENAPEETEDREEKVSEENSDHMPVNILAESVAEKSVANLADYLTEEPGNGSAEGVPQGAANGSAENVPQEPANGMAENVPQEPANGVIENIPQESANGVTEGVPQETQEMPEEEWVYVESGDVRGFVRKESLSYGKEISDTVEEKKEDSFLLAEEKIKPEDNAACYYTLTSTKSGIPSGEIRKSMVEYAAQFIGNPYVWGGTSLTEGADCSGFVQSIYKQYGYDIPRVACDQAEYGIKIPVEDALPGDLIFYAKNGYIHHVVMYAGGGKTIEAMSTNMGIVQADVRTDSAVWATRVLDDNGYEYAGGGISDVNATPDMYGMDLGTFKLTYYCACELCCDVETGITATGAPVVEGRTIAVDPRVIPYGTQVIIGGHVFTAEDCGGAIKGNHIDVYVNDHEKAQALGVNYANVYLKK